MSLVRHHGNPSNPQLRGLLLCLMIPSKTSTQSRWHRHVYRWRSLEQCMCIQNHKTTIISGNESCIFDKSLDSRSCRKEIPWWCTVTSLWQVSRDSHGRINEFKQPVAQAPWIWGVVSQMGRQTWHNCCSSFIHHDPTELILSIPTLNATGCLHLLDT